jgi:hypothetical protein
VRRVLHVEAEAGVEVPPTVLVGVDVPVVLLVDVCPSTSLGPVMDAFLADAVPVEPTVVVAQPALCDREIPFPVVGDDVVTLGSLDHVRLVDRVRILVTVASDAETEQRVQGPLSGTVERHFIPDEQSARVHARDDVLPQVRRVAVGKDELVLDVDLRNAAGVVGDVALYGVVPDVERYTAFGVPNQRVQVVEKFDITAKRGGLFE